MSLFCRLGAMPSCEFTVLTTRPYKPGSPCNDRCLEVFVLCGSADKIKSFFYDIRRDKRADCVNLIVPWFVKDHHLKMVAC